MKYALVLCSILLSSTALAETHHGVVPYLDFDESYVESAQFKSNSYLDVEIENWQFPDRTAKHRRQKEKFRQALNILEEVMNSDEFRRMVLSYKRSDGKRLFQKNYLWSNSGSRLSNEDVYNLLMQGNESKVIPNTKGEMNINSFVKICTNTEWNVTNKRWCRGVIGSTNPWKSKWMTLNWQFYATYSVPSMVSNIVHEWIHLLGFLHGNVNMREEVPYVVGSIAGKVATQILNSRNFVAQIN